MKRNIRAKTFVLPPHDNAPKGYWMVATFDGRGRWTSTSFRNTKEGALEYARNRRRK
jgi:hypothetical protein